MAAKKWENQFTIRFNNSTDPRIIEFLNMQGNKTDTIAYLIEEELKRNGMRNLQKIIPPVRDLPVELPGEKKEDDVKIEEMTVNNVVEKEEGIEINDCFED